MRLIRFGPGGKEKPGIVSITGQRLDCSAYTADWSAEHWVGEGYLALEAWLRHNEKSCPIVPDSVRLGPPIPRPSKIICVGKNYDAHAREMGELPTEEPVLFMKASSALAGAHDPVTIPLRRRRDGSEVAAAKVDWEVELAAVIGLECVNCSPETALSYVAGYTMHNDLSERNAQLECGGQWVKGKSFDTFAPMGPWLATRNDVEDTGALSLWLKVNDELKQSDTTENMIFSVAELVSYVSWHMRLLPGDVVSTGTPSGVAAGAELPRYLSAGDRIEYGIDGLGVAKKIVVNGA